MSIVLQGSTSGSVTLQEPAVAGTTVLDLPATSGTVATLTTPSFATTIGVGGATPSTSGAGITFPATQSASTDANTLDDYEEGAWTPVLGGATSETGQAYDRQAGRYVKVGRVVTCSFDVALSTEGTITGNATLKGLPFVSGSDGAASGKGNRAGLCTGGFFNLGNSVVFLSGFIGEGATSIEFLQLTSAGSGTSSIAGSTLFTNTTQIIGSITYITA
jgi:hypothetical protein